MADCCEKLLRKKAKKKHLLNKLDEILSEITRITKKRAVINDLYSENIVKQKKLKKLYKKLNKKVNDLLSGDEEKRKEMFKKREEEKLNKMKMVSFNSPVNERLDEIDLKNDRKMIHLSHSIKKKKRPKFKIFEELDVKQQTFNDDDLLSNKSNSILNTNEPLHSARFLSPRNKRHYPVPQTNNLRNNKSSLGSLEDINFQLKNKMTTLSSKILTLEKEFKQTYLRSMEVSDEIRALRININSRINEHRQYYLEILKKGIDVRKDGLSWVLVKLLELNTFIQNYMFPQYLHSDHIEYLNEVALKQYEVSELIKLFQVMKKKQQKLKDKFADSHEIDDYNVGIVGEINKKGMKVMSLSSRSQAESSVRNKTEDTNFTRDIEQFMLHDNLNDHKSYIKKLEDIAKKYDRYINVAVSERKEERFINIITQDLHNKIQNGVRDLYDEENFNKMYFLPGSLAQFFNENKKYREHFDDIFYLRTTIFEKEQALKKFKHDFMKEFKEKTKAKSLEYSEENELLFSALFGNGIYV